MTLQLRSASSVHSRGRRGAWGPLLLVATFVALSECSLSVVGPASLLNGTAQAQPPPTSDHAPLPDPLHLPDDVWATVRDDAVLRDGEQDAVYRLISQLSQVDARALHAASEGTIGFPPLHRQTADYRGKIVTVTGIARRSLAVKAEANDLGLKKYFQVWIRPEDTTDGPVVVYCLELPPHFPMGYDIEAPVTLDAIVFKRWRYSATDGMHVAPLLLARNLQWEPDRVASRRLAPNWGLVLAAAALITASAVGWNWYLSSRARRSTARRSTGP